MNLKTNSIIMAVMLAAISLQAREYHVATTGLDSNKGSQAKPFLTIQHAADIAQPGDTVTVHKGVYRERINPPRGGTSDDNRIVYQVARGENAVIKGSEVVKGWEKVSNDTWKVTLPNTFFGDFSPYRDLVAGDWFRDNGREHHTGVVYLNGHWLTEAGQLEHVLMPVAAAAAHYIQGKGGSVLLNIAWLRPAKGQRVEANRYDSQQGVRTAPCSEGDECIGWLEHGDWVCYEQMEFGRNCSEIEIRAASASQGGVIELRLGTPNGERLGTCKIPNTGGWQSWSSFRAKIKPTSGIQTLCLVFRDAHIQLTEEQRLWFSQVDESNTTIWAQFKGVNPNKENVEINVRQSVFYPEEPGINYITVRGFTLEHAATNWA
ncbi:MAG: carbohydrate-binding protein, partial [Planctomycetes bacterium]|nr:carbohydrate-binding protein [Planctomycetota bacterium]